MFKRILALVGVLLLLAVTVLPVLADTYLYTTPIYAENGNSTSLSYSPVLLDFPISSYVSLGYLNADGLNSRMQEYGTNVGYAQTTTKLGLVVPSLSGLQSKEYSYMTGYSPNNTSFQFMTGHNGYVGIANAAVLNPSGNFTLDMLAYIDTTAGSSKYLVTRSGCLSTYVNPTVSGNITSDVYGTPVTANCTPNAAGAYANITGATPAVAHYLNVDDPPGAADDGATYVNTNSAAGQKDVYNLTTVTWPTGSIINWVTVYFKVYRDAGGLITANVTPYLRLGTDETSGTPWTVPNAWTTSNQTLSRPGGGTWSTTDIDTLQAGIGLQGNGAQQAYCTQVYIQVSYSVPTSVSVANIPSGLTRVVTTLGAGNLSLLVYDSLGNLLDFETKACGAAYNSGNSWILGLGDCLSAVSYYKHIVGGNLITWYQPNAIISGTTLVDRQGGDQPGLIEWGGRTASSGNITCLVDTELTQADNYWVGKALKIKQTTDGLAPQGESANITASSYTSYNVTVGTALTAGLDPGDRYEIWNLATNTILFGDFPDGMTIGLGTLLASTTPVPTTTTSATPQVLTTPKTPSNLYGSTAAGDPTWPAYDLFDRAANSIGWSVRTVYGYGIIVIGIVLAVVVLMTTGSLLGGAAALTAALAWGTSMGVLPVWFIIIYALFGVSWIYTTKWT